MYKVIKFEKETEYIEKFLDLPIKIYSKKEIMQNRNEEMEILTETHVLSRYFQIYRFLVVDDKNSPCARAIVTIYPDDPNAYIGFFESIKSAQVSKILLEEAENFIHSLGKEKIVGPMDCSIWIKYRFKVNEFSHPYTGEPYNKPYYPKMFLDAGYQIAVEYKSNQYAKVAAEIDEKKYSQRLEKAKEDGYRFLSPKKENFAQTLKQVYKLLIELYSNFPGYKFVEEAEFTHLFAYLNKIINYNMVKLVYDNEQLVGFFISIPNYKNIVYGKLTLLDYLKILKIKLITKEYVMLYMGIDLNHRGLGKALTEEIKEELKRNQATSIGALIRKGNINENYFETLIEKEYHYVLMEKVINSVSS